MSHVNAHTATCRRATAGWLILGHFLWPSRIHDREQNGGRRNQKARVGREAAGVLLSAS